MRLLLGLAILFGGAAGALAYLVAPDPVRLVAGASAPDGRRIIRIDFEGSVFEVPEGLIARVKRGTFGPVRQLDLVAPWPYDPEKPPTVGEAEHLKEWLLIQFEPEDGRLGSRERFEKVFVHYFSGPPSRADAGLVQYDFAPDSPYAEMQLFVDRQANPPVFLRCDLKPSSLGPVLCERRYKLTDRIYLRYRFDRDWLARWIEVDSQVGEIVRQVLRRPGA